MPPKGFRRHRIRQPKYFPPTARPSETLYAKLQTASLQPPRLPSDIIVAPITHISL
ncbi:MAG TPA: hypothetical protein PL031_06775 [Neisseria sp.]|nr:hypothetical protein [Neisseria sp.]